MSFYSEYELERRRKEYFALKTEQEKADYLYNNWIGGGALNLSPNQYPKVPPSHKPCKFCGGKGKEERTSDNMNILYASHIVCERCGRSTKPCWSFYHAWHEWDDGYIVNVDGQMSIFDYIGGEQ